MTISAFHFVDVSVQVAGATVDRFGFGNYMHVAEHNITTSRQDGPFASLADVAAAGFTEGAAPTVYWAAAAAFSVDNAVNQLWVGRKIPAAGGPLDRVWQFDDSTETLVNVTAAANSAGAGDWVLFPASEAVGDAVRIGSRTPFNSVTFSSAGGTAGVDGGALELAHEAWDGSAWVPLAGVVDGTSDFTEVAGAGQVLSFTAPPNWAPAILDGEPEALYYIQIRIVAGDYSTNPIYSQAVITGDASWTAALSAIEATVGAGSDDWYGFTIESRVKADLLAVGAWTEPRFKRYIPQSADVDFRVGTAGNVGLELKALGYWRTMGPLYHAVSDGAANGYLDAAMASRGFGFNLDAPNGHDNWMFQSLQGIAPDPVTNAQAQAIWAANGNVYASTLGSSFVSKGTTAAGEPYFMDIISAVDWFKRRAEEDVIAHFVANRPSYDNAGIQGVAAVVKQRLDIGVRVGAFSGDHPRTVIVPDVSEVSTADKQARLLTLECSAVFRGKIQKLDFTLAVQF